LNGAEEKESGCKVRNELPRKAHAPPDGSERGIRARQSQSFEGRGGDKQGGARGRRRKTLIMEGRKGGSTARRSFGEEKKTIEG